MFSVHIVLYIPSSIIPQFCREDAVAEVFQNYFEIRESDRIEEVLGFTVEDSSSEIELHNMPMTTRF